MTEISLATWADHGWLKPHRITRNDIARLLRNAATDLNDATADISPAWRFAIAYNAALQLATAVLHAAGYRAAREQKHYRTIVALPLALGEQVAELTAFLDRCRAKRHEATYESVDAVSGPEADELITAVRELDTVVRRWLAVHHSELM